MNLKEINEIVSGSLKGDESLAIDGIATTPAEAQEGELAFVFPDKFAKAKKYLENSKAKALIIAQALFDEQKFQDYIADEDINLILVKRPKFALSQISPKFVKERFKPSGVHPTAVIDETAKLANGVCVGAMSYIGPGVEVGANTVIQARVTVNANSRLGKDCHIHSGVVIEDYSQIGNRVEIHPNAVIGSDGYSYTTQEATNLEKMQKGDFSFNMDRQVQHKVVSAGNVVIEDDVEIGANTCIDRATLASTKIGQGTKIDNLVQIAHNVELGKDCLIISQTGIAGSAKIGDRVTMAGSSGCGDGVSVGNDVVCAAFSAINSDVDPFLPVMGAPAVPYGEFLKRQRAFVRLPKTQDEVRKLKREVDKLGKVTN